MKRQVFYAVCLVLGVFSLLSSSRGAEFLVGAASTDITPPEPVALRGQFALRIAHKVETPLTANVVALESRDGDESSDIAILVSCDLIAIPESFLELLRTETRKRLADVNAKKLIVNGTHTHTAPVLEPGRYKLPEKGVMSVEECRSFIARRIAEAIEKAWDARQPGSVTWGLSDALVGRNRRGVYADGHAEMLGDTARPTFRGIEGYEDHEVGTLFFWNAEGKLISIAVNVCCPSQEVGGRSTINADFWHPAREALQERHGEDVCILAWTGAAGDQCPHLRYHKAAELRMRRLRGGNENARRIARAVNEAYEVVKDDRYANVPLVHRVETIELPLREVTEAEYAQAKAAYQEAADAIAQNPQAADSAYRRMKWHEQTIQRYQAQQADPKPTYEMELHVVRLGDAVICTNPFELFTEYGVCIKARSKALQTFVIQLVGNGTYLPTHKAVRGGGYSAVVQSSVVGPEGGQVLVDKTVEAINALWSTPEEKSAGTP